MLVEKKKKDDQTQIVKELTSVFAQKSPKAFSRILNLQIWELTPVAESLTQLPAPSGPAFRFCKACSSEKTDPLDWVLHNHREKTEKL